MEKRRLTGTLAPSNRLVDLVLAGLEVDKAILTETARWGNKLQCEAQRWMVRGGLAERGRISKADAHRIFAASLGQVRK